ncbi:amino acid ABC transporter substrate-binding protein [Marinobacter sediminum]|uniref:substrate-binding periplasmic protein n=1 Tax=Marinobacter sediminum TaxID=256323 RepID=UPI00202FBDEC|nr:transporter substrate-binding domain-containing protein [Marinobacter sediminum]MCM0613442.1 amino acid ABC transporter substrate-binding protein [Marinobacter sediminum]
MRIRSIVSIFPMLIAGAVLAEPPVLKAATTEYPPFEYVENGQLRGRDVETVRTVIQRMGYTPEFQILPWARAELMVRNGSADLLFSLTASPKRQRHFLFTAPISTAKDVFYARKSSDVSWKSLSDLADMRVGVSASYSYAPEFMNWLKEAEVRVMTVSQEQPDLSGLRLVALDRIDLFICEQTACNYLIQKYQKQYPELSQVESIPGVVGQERAFRAAFSRQRPDAKTLRLEFNRVLRQVRQTSSD